MCLEIRQSKPIPLYKMHKHRCAILDLIWVYGHFRYAIHSVCGACLCTHVASFPLGKVRPIPAALGHHVLGTIVMLLLHFGSDLVYLKHAQLHGDEYWQNDIGCHIRWCCIVGCSIPCFHRPHPLHNYHNRVRCDRRCCNHKPHALRHEG